MQSFLIFFGKDFSIEVTAVLSRHGTIGSIGSELFAFRTEDKIDTIRHRINEELPDLKNVLIAEVSDTSYRGDASISYAARLLNGEI
jgi:hypothetical protein